LLPLPHACPSWLAPTTPFGAITGRRNLLSGFESSLLRDCVDLPLARQKITAATIETFAEPLIHIEIARLMACRAKAPWGDLHRLASLLMKDHRHIVVCSPNLCDRHRLSPLYWGVAHASHQFLAEVIPPCLRCWTGIHWINSQNDFPDMLRHRTPFHRVGSRTPVVYLLSVDKLCGQRDFTRSKRCYTHALAQDFSREECLRKESVPYDDK
jgi:hypothetical protein